ncbi:MAG: glycosyltransferase family 2 protein [Bacteroidetes bacterium]|nr:glycosyltransferase family 2 protein [Bacteroidota bacterium]MCB9227617.1 glycosyltransferase family 2 protein [Chitinophagales bacterium]
MYKNKRIIVVMPAYNAALTLEKTVAEIPEWVDEVILTDDASKDNTVEVAKKIGIKNILIHDKNKGYGGNQKTCYNKALELNGDIVIMLHPDYQYTPKLIPSLVNLIAEDLFPVALGSRILGNGALKGGMPWYKYVANRILTFTQNLFTGQKLSEYHTGYRAFSKEALNAINYNSNSDDFIFDNEMLSQLIYKDIAIGEVTCPTKYFEEASSINLKRSAIYGIGCLKYSLLFRLNKMGLLKSKIFYA